tara:strand:- start:1517 stop:2566 length:1050 start_codon:yes stop_codon:yes gene_type:complete
MAIYERFQTEADNPDNPDVLTGIRDVISSGMWSGGSGTLTTYFTSSTQSGSTGAYYLDVFKTNPDTDSTAEVQFSVAYGHFNGSGSKGGKGIVGTRASAAIYGQMSNVLLGPGEDKFVMANGKVLNHAYFISLQRARLREKMDPGNWELHISGSQGFNNIKLIDDSGATTDPTVNQGGRVFNIVSGSITNGVATINTTAANETASGSAGLFFPDLGILVFNPQYLAGMGASPHLAISTGSNANSGNTVKFYQAISSSKYFQARREEVISSTHYFCRVGNKKFNFSSNPTYFTASDGSFTQPTFFKNPKSYITQVGLYNDANELLAVAKLSKPLLKSFAREAIVKVKLDF